MKQTNNKKNPLQNLVLISQLGFSMIVPIMGCFLLGRFLDVKFDTGNLFLIVFTILGIMAAFRNLFVIGMKSGTNRRDDTNK
ncbi:F0F1 ATP synthase subunit [Alkalibaculum sp. M08DMB]|uniref:F0F1 ATP synthase subunit n=1 Tax=Alkalibaculum sporogenes TaxID=2655001 RepID=A0A6A7KBT9_9FIRM|nr:AtpZ/AtpI family protein [Alkalibaculum sporogenes]MPW27010.1 F0F1 ATP synthase subunit [Alkalibaculum sporogenes]